MFQDSSIVDRPGYFGKRRAEKEHEYDSKYGKGNWTECWEYGDSILTFSQAVSYYDLSYYIFLKYHPNIADYVSFFDECCDDNITNIDCGYEHAPNSYPRHIQDVSVRRAMRDLDRPFRKTGIPSGEQNLNLILEIRGTRTNGFLLNPGMIPFFNPTAILGEGVGGPIPTWVKDKTSVEAFWQRNKVILAVNV